MAFRAINRAYALYRKRDYGTGNRAKATISALLLRNDRDFLLLRDGISYLLLR